MIDVLIVDDHEAVRRGMRSLIAIHADLRVVGEAANASQALLLARASQPNVALLDIRMPDRSGIDIIRELRAAAPACRVIVLSSFDDDEYVEQALQRGAQGYLTKGASQDVLIGAIRAAHHGERVLSPNVMSRVVARFTEFSQEHARRQLGLSDDDMGMLRMLIDGASNITIAARTFMSEATVKRKLQDIFRKLGVTTRAQAAAEAVRRNLM